MVLSGHGGVKEVPLVWQFTVCFWGFGSMWVQVTAVNIIMTVHNMASLNA